MDRDEVKKILISILNLKPNGILADEINREFLHDAGCSIPYGRFGYHSLMAFLEWELKENIRIDNENGWDIVLYPIATHKSEHILKFKAIDKQNSDRKRHGNQSQMRPVRQQSQRAQVRAPTQSTKPEERDVSPTMPALVQYRPFVKMNSNSNASTTNVFRNTYLHDRLIQSQKAYIARNRLQTTSAASTRSNSTAPSNQQNHSHQMNDTQRTIRSHGTSNNHQSKQSGQSGMTSRFARLALQHKPQIPNGDGDAGVQNKSQPTPSSSNSHQSVEPGPNASNQKTVATTNAHTATGTPVQVSSKDDFEDLWVDELENVQPPTINRSNPSSFYGVSDLSAGSTSSKSSIDSVHKRMLEASSDDEVKISEIPDLLSEFQGGDILPARVSDTNNPLKFWIHVRQEKYTLQINDMYKKMQEFYNLNKNSEELRIKDLDEVDSGYFAVEYNNQWHRVEPYDTRMGEAVRISFLDHGSREIVNVSKLRRLDRQFWSTPKAAVCCGLGNIKPIDTTFSTKSANAFVDLVEDEKVYAKILHIDDSKKKAIVELIMDKGKLCVNDELVRLNYAIQKPARANA